MASKALWHAVKGRIPLSTVDWWVGDLQPRALGLIVRCVLMHGSYWGFLQLDRTRTTRNPSLAGGRAGMQKSYVGADRHQPFVRFPAL